MAIANANMSYEGQGPTGTLQRLAVGNLFGGIAQTLVGFVTLILDGAATTATVNFIDGTAALEFTPSGIIAFRTGGTGLSTISAVGASSLSTTGFTLTISAAGTNTQTVTFALIVLK